MPIMLTNTVEFSLIKVSLARDDNDISNHCCHFVCPE